MATKQCNHIPKFLNLIA